MVDSFRNPKLLVVGRAKPQPVSDLIKVVTPSQWDQIRMRVMKEATSIDCQHLAHGNRANGKSILADPGKCALSDFRVDVITGLAVHSRVIQASAYRVFPLRVLGHFQLSDRSLLRE
jgi:hypothetical protein